LIWLRRALVNTLLNLRVPRNVGKFFPSCITGGFSRSSQFHSVHELLLKDDMGSTCSTHGVKSNAQRVSVGKPEGKRPSQDLDISGKVILKWKDDGVLCTGLMWLRIGTGGGLL
jgi:hypothetical protein